jgi:hypothetical protein
MQIFSSILPKNMKIKIYRIIIIHVVLCGRNLRLLYQGKNTLRVNFVIEMRCVFLEVGIKLLNVTCINIVLL